MKFANSIQNKGQMSVRRSNNENIGQAHTRWSIVLPFYNETGFLEDTLASLAVQTLRSRLILVDNGSTDTSLSLAHGFRQSNPDLEIAIFEEPKAGKAYALARGIKEVKTPYFATADADTYYPPEYMKRTDNLFQKADTNAVAAMAFGAPMPDAPGHFATLKKGAFVSRLMARQTHSGGYGQSFRTNAIRAVGGFDPDIWQYCLMDHEIMHRLTKLYNGKGRLLYDRAHWCSPSPRRNDRSKVRWTLSERLLYHICPFSRRDWFFYEFLAKRFKARGLSQLNLRKQVWTSKENTSDYGSDTNTNEKSKDT